MFAIAAGGFDGDSILLPENSRPKLRLWLGKHPIISDDRSDAGLRRFDATLTNSDLERLESGQCRQQRTVGIGFALDEMQGLRRALYPEAA
jgi:hypothetical protein